MNRKSKIYSILKKCETPPLHSRFWLFMSLLYNTIVLLLGKVLLCQFQYVYKERKCKLIPVFSNGDLLVFYRSIHEIENANHLDQPAIIIIPKQLGATAKVLGIENLNPVSNWQILALGKASIFFVNKNVIVSHPWHFFDITQINMNAALNCIPNSASNSIYIEVLSEEEYRGKCVVLSPYEQSFASLNLPRLPQSHNGYECHER